MSENDDILNFSTKINFLNAQEKKQEIDYKNKIIELNEIIIEKEEKINSLQNKLLDFSNIIDKLQIEKNKLSQNLENIKYSIFPNNKLYIQPTQRFIILNEINNDNNNELNLTEVRLNNNKLKSGLINEKFRSKITHFKFQPLKVFDHRKLKVSYRQYEQEFLNDELLNDIINNNSKIIDNMTSLSIEKNISKNYSIEQYEDSKLNSEREKNNSKSNLEGIKLHSSLFFKNCKKIMNINEYKKLLEIVKLSNKKLISKEDTYLKITSLLDNNYPELSNEFKLLFI